MTTIKQMPNDFCPTDCKMYNPFLTEAKTTTYGDIHKQKLVVLHCEHEEMCYLYRNGYFDREV